MSNMLILVEMHSLYVTLGANFIVFSRNVYYFLYEFLNFIPSEVFVRSQA